MTDKETELYRDKLEAMSNDDLLGVGYVAGLRREAIEECLAHQPAPRTFSAIASVLHG